MANQKRFPRPSVVFLDGDQAAAPGCSVLPGNDAPERVVFENLQSVDWPGVADRVGRSPSETIDALNAAMALSDHHDWVKFAGDRLTLGGDTLWQALASSWAKNCATQTQIQETEQIVRDVLGAMRSQGFPHRFAAAFLAISARFSGAKALARAHSTLLAKRLGSRVFFVVGCEIVNLARSDLRHHDGGPNHVCRSLLAFWSLGHV